MKLKKELKTARQENEALRAIVMDVNSGKALSPADMSERLASISISNTRAVSATDRPQALPQLVGYVYKPFIRTTDSFCRSGLDAPSGMNELTHTKQLLSKFIEENRDMKSQNVCYLALQR
jgi:hypothetical protein